MNVVRISYIVCVKMLLIAILFCVLHTIFSVPSDFLLDIDGTSISTTHDHSCVISYKHGVDVGGKVICWNGDEDREFHTPENVSIYL